MDILLDVMLGEIARAPYGAGTLYFKGGIAIRKLFIPGYRYSEDLDFTFEGRGTWLRCDTGLQTWQLRWNRRLANPGGASVCARLAT
jgi:predicted nucleotidyltransferase component of viral defense system